MAVREFLLPAVLPPLESVLARLGYNPNKSQMDDSLRSIINETLRDSAKLIHPAAHMLEAPLVKKTADSVVLENGLVFASAKLAAVLSESVSVSLLACTIGNELKNEAGNASNAGEMTRAVILDAVASEAVEAFADRITDILTREHRLTGLRPTMRFSPGYGDWKTDIHDRLLFLLEAEKIGIRCHPENFILTPEKSITAVIGWMR